MATLGPTNRLKPSGIASKESIIRVHLVPALGSRRLDQITNEDIQRLKHRLRKKSPKTVNNVLTVLNTLLKVAVEWGVIETMPCTVKLLKVSRPPVAFHDFGDFNRLVKAAESVDHNAHLIVLLGGEAGLRCGEMMALEWRDVDLERGQLTVRSSEWKGQVTATKGGRIRHVPLTERLKTALRRRRPLRGSRVLVERKTGSTFTQKMVQDRVRWAARRANVKDGVHILRHTFCSHLAMRGGPRVAPVFRGYHPLLNASPRRPGRPACPTCALPHRCRVWRGAFSLDTRP